MTWGALSFLWFGLLGIPLVILYLRRIRQRPVEVPSLVFWDLALERTEATSLLRHLRRLLSLLLLLLIGASLIAAAARPLFVRGQLEPHLYVVILDASASMAARDGTDGDTRFDRARRVAGDVLAGIDEPDRGALVVASGPGEPFRGGSGEGAADRPAGGVLAAPPSSDARALLAAVAAAQVTTVPGTLTEAFDTARELVRGQSLATVVLVSDFAGDAARWAQEAPELHGASFTRAPVGLPLANFYLKGVGARANIARAGDRLSVVAAAAPAANAASGGAPASSSPHPLELHITIDGALARVLPIELAPGESVMRETDLDLNGGGLVRVELVAPAGGSAADPFALDNVARAVVPPAHRARVAILAPAADGANAAFFISAAIRSMPDVVDLDGSVVARPDELSAEQLAGFDVIICDGAYPPSLPARVGLLSASPTGAADGAWPAEIPARAVTAEPVELPVIEQWDREHAVNRFVSFQQLLVARASPFNLTRTGVPLVECPQGVLAAAYDLPRGRIVHAGFRFDETDAIFRVTFPVFLRNAILWLSPRHQRLVTEVETAGRSVRNLHSLDETVREIEVSRLADAESSAATGVLAARSLGFAFADTAEAGFYRFRAGAEVDFTAINFVGAAESELAPALVYDAERLAADLPQPRRFSLWPWLAAAALALLSLEWILFGWRLTE